MTAPEPLPVPPGSPDAPSTPSATPAPEAVSAPAAAAVPTPAAEPAPPQVPQVAGARSVRAASSDREPALQRPLASYVLLLASTGLLLVIGLVMVFSASSVRSFATYGSSSTIAMKQAIFIALGLPLMWGASRMPVRFWRAAAYPMLLLCVLLLVLVLVPGIGRNVDGATRWIPLPGGFNLQPSEIAKLALAVWGADLLARKHKLLGDWKHLLVPLLPVTCLLGGLIMLEPDMGTTMSLATVLLALLWVAGTPMRYFVALLGLFLALASFMAVAEPYRMRRVASFLDPFADPEGGGYQAVQGLYALSSGGFFGVGLGGGQSKWSGVLPNTHTDYIFAVIGEELGLLGTFTVLGLIATFAYAGVRIAKRSDDPFVRLATIGVTTWIVAQSVINIGAVVGLLPITGIPLPLISFGGSAMIPTLIAIGMLLSFARAEPGAAAALRARPGVLGRLRLGSSAPVRAPGRTATRAARVPARTTTGGASTSRTTGRTTGRTGTRTSAARAAGRPRRPSGRR